MTTLKCYFILLLLSCAGNTTPNPDFTLETTENGLGPNPTTQIEQPPLDNNEDNTNTTPNPDFTPETTENGLGPNPTTQIKQPLLNNNQENTNAQPNVKGEVEFNKILKKHNLKFDGPVEF